MARKILVILLGTLSLACGEERAPPSVDAAARRGTSAEPVVLFLGTSLTAGYGLELEQAYPALIQQRIDSAGLEFRVVNAGESGRTSAGGLARIDWLLREPVAVLVLELGANDGLRGLDPDELRQNLQEIVDLKVFGRDPEVVQDVLEGKGMASTSHDRDAFSAMVQAWVDHGFAVVMVNYRGSTGYGRERIRGAPIPGSGVPSKALASSLAVPRLPRLPKGCKNGG